METEESYLRIIRGQSRGFFASVLRGLLLGFSLPYRVGTVLYHAFWNRNERKAAALPVPVISVGNITTGGTGKSPMIAYLVDLLLKEGHFPGVLSRGYKAQLGGVNDEAKELSLRFASVPHYQNSDRVVAARSLLRDHPEVDILLLDDGMQYRALKKDLELILLDATDPFGCDHLLPRGLLREPTGALRRGDMTLVSRADLVDDSALEAIRQKVFRIVGDRPWGALTHAPIGILRWSGGHIQRTPFTVEAFPSPAFLFCGIGNSEGFFQMARRQGIIPAGERAFPDHCRYTEEQMASLVQEARSLGAGFLVCTVKDLVKLEKFSFDIPLVALEIGLVFRSGEESLRSRVLGLF